MDSSLERYSDPKFENIEYELSIFSDSVVFEASTATVRRAVEMDVKASERNPKIVVAIVATQRVIRGLANLYRLQTEATGGLWKTAYFETEEEARRWLAETLD